MRRSPLRLRMGIMSMSPFRSDSPKGRTRPRSVLLKMPPVRRWPTRGARGRWSASPTGVSRRSGSDRHRSPRSACRLMTSGTGPAMQLEVEQDLGGLRGYSGSAVFNDEGQVTGLLVTQKLKRANGLRPEASDVMFALSIVDVARSLRIDVALARPTLGSCCGRASSRSSRTTRSSSPAATSAEHD